MDMGRFTKKRIIGFLIATLLPLLVIGWGEVVFFKFDRLFNLSYAVTYLILPLATIFLLGLFVFLLRIHTAIKVFLVVVLNFFFLIAFLFFVVFGYHESLSCAKNEEIGEAYTEVCASFETMPTLDELGDYSEVKHYDYFGCVLGIFEWDSDTLIVEYDVEEYQKQKIQLEQTFIFQETEIIRGDNRCDPVTQIDNFTFRAVAIDGEYEDVAYPEKMILVATNDHEHKIAYVVFYDDDLDFIEDLESFLLNECGWKYIR